MLIQVRKLRAEARPQKIFQKFTLQNGGKDQLQNSIKILLHWDGWISYHMSTVFNQTDFRAFQECLNFAGGQFHCRSFQEVVATLRTLCFVYNFLELCSVPTEMIKKRLDRKLLMRTKGSNLGNKGRTDQLFFPKQILAQMRCRSSQNTDSPKGLHTWSV